MELMFGWVGDLVELVGLGWVCVLGWVGHFVRLETSLD